MRAIGFGFSLAGRAGGLRDRLLARLLLLWGESGHVHVLLRTLARAGDVTQPDGHARLTINVGRFPLAVQTIAIAPAALD